MAEENMTHVAGTEPPENPLARSRATTLKLKPVIRKPTLGATGIPKPAIPSGMKLPTQGPAKPAPAAAPAEGAMEQLKSVTQKLKGVTQQIPQQAILHKTGIIADQDLTEAQRQASKSRTARISLSDALGVAPVQNEAAPMKTIRIKRPDAISKPTPAAPAPVAAESAGPAAAPAAAPTLTQRKTLKISRPGQVRPSGKFGVKKTGAPAPEAAAPAEGEVADIPDIPDMPAGQPRFQPATVPANAIPDVSKATNIASIIFQVAACVVVGLLGYYLYLDMQLPLFCGGCGWGQ